MTALIVRNRKAMNLPLAARPQFHGDAFSGAVAEAAADIGAADDEILAVIGASADQDMDMWVVGIPVIDRHPVELRSEVALDIIKQFARERAQVLQFAGVFGRNDKTKVMPVIPAAFGEGAFVGHFRVRVEHPSIFAVSGDSLPFQVIDVLGEGRRAEAAALVTHNTRLHHHAPGVRPQLDGDRSSPAAAEPGAAPALAWSEAIANMPRPLCGPHDLAYEGLWTLGTTVAVVDPSRPDAQIIITRCHNAKPPCTFGRRRSEL
jgi:hypothetical protein